MSETVKPESNTDQLSTTVSGRLHKFVMPIADMTENTLIEAYKTNWYDVKAKYGISCGEAEAELKMRKTPICPVCFMLLRNGLKVCCGVWQT